MVVALGFNWAVALAYVLSWALLRTYLWRDGKVLRRQYEERIVRVAEEQAARRRAR